MKGQLGNMMRQAQEMQANMKKLQEELATLEVTGSAGAGMVEVVMTCRHEVRKVNISPEVFEEDREMLEDLLAAAVNDASQRVERTSQEKMSEVTGGIELPPGFNIG
jgi:DNA-binding YbaB/EbfC family protein